MGVRRHRVQESPSSGVFWDTEPTPRSRTQAGIGFVPVKFVVLTVFDDDFFFKFIKKLKSSMFAFELFVFEMKLIFGSANCK